MPENGSVNGGAGRDAPDRPDSNDRGGAREEKEAKAAKAETFDRAMDNANRPDRAPPAPDNTTTSKPDDKDEPSETDKPDNRQERASGPPGIGAPPNSPSPTDTAKNTDDNKDQEERGFLDRVADTLSAPPTDAEGNARSTSPVSDRINNTQNYSVDDIKNVFAANEPVVTPEQNQSLADGAAAMDEVTAIPASYNKPATTPRNAAIEMANAELSVGLEVQRREIETLTGQELDHIDQQIADAKTQRAETLERYEAAQKVSFDDFGAPQQVSSFEIEQHANDFKQANDRIEALEKEREAIEHDQALPNAIERAFIAKDSYNVESHLRGSHMERLTDDQLPDGLKTSDLVNPETGFAASIYENHRSGSVELAARGTDFGLGMDEFRRDMRANAGEGIGVTTDQSEQAKAIGDRFAKEFEGREMHAVGHSLGGTNASTMAAAAGIEGTVFNSGPMHDDTLDKYSITREDMAERVTNYRVEGDLVTSGLESPVVDAAVGIATPGIAAIATIRNGGDPIPNAVGDPHDLPAANPESSMLEKHSTREVIESLLQEQQRVIDEHRAGQLSR